MKIIPYKMGSQSAKALAEALGILQIRHEGKPLRKLKTLINWGCSNIPRNVGEAAIINDMHSVRNASNKLATFRLFKEVGVDTPEWTESREEANKWLVEGFDVCARHKLNGHSGDGLEIVLGEKNNPNFAHNIPAAPLYTKYVPKKEEYRVHVFRGNVIFVQRKARKKEVPDENVNWKVRNLNGGFIFTNGGVAVPDGCNQLCISAVRSLALDFGAVDVIYNEKQNKYYVLEVNTAPGLTGKTLEAYTEVFNGLAT